MKVYMRSIWMFSFLFLIVGTISSQDIPLYTWRTHFASRLGRTAAIVGNDIYVGCEQSMYSYNTKTNSYRKYSKADGMSGYEINKIAYDSVSSNIIITYTDGNIDFLKDGIFTNLADFFLNSFSGSKETNHINIYNGFAFISTNAGLLLIDIQKKEIKETYAYIGPNASLVSVYSSLIYHDSIFIATDNGVMAGSFSPSVNLQNFNKWTTLNIPLTDKKTISITQFNGTIYAIVGNGVYYKNGNKLELSYHIGIDSDRRFLSTYSNLLYISYSNRTLVFDKNITYFGAYYADDIVDFIYKNNTAHVISKTNSLGIWNNIAQRYDYKSPSSPYTNLCGRVRFFDGETFLVSGNIAPSGEVVIETGNINIFNNYEWKNIISGKDSAPEFLTPYDLILKQDTIYAPCFNGFLKIHNNTHKGILYDETNSNLTPFAPNQGNNYYMCSSIAENSNGDLFIGQGFRSKGDYSFFKNKPGGNFGLFYSDPENGRLIRKMMIDRNDNIWHVSQKLGWSGAEGFFNSDGMTVYNPNSTSSIKYKNLTDKETEGKLTSKYVNAVAETKSGEVWLGTDNGISIITDPQKIFTSATIPLSTVPVYDSRALLRDKIVNTISIDAADRKWISTANDGVWLFSANGDSLLKRFTTENSPLPSNEVYDIGVNPVNGEVYFATQKGLVSYRNDAAEPNIVTDEGTLTYPVKAFPNPVTPDFSGTVGLSGLGPNAIVKITDISGKLVYETKANGGMASWNCKDLNGSKVASGIYIVFSATSTGEFGIVTKIAVIN